MSKAKRPNSSYQYDFSETWVLRKNYVSRNIHVSEERDNFSCPNGHLYFRVGPTIDIGINKEEYRLADKRNKYNRMYERIYGDEV